MTRRARRIRDQAIPYNRGPAILCDVCVLVAAARPDHVHHQLARDAIASTLTTAMPFAVCSLLLAGFLRVGTHRKIFPQPLALDEALALVDRYRVHPNAVRVDPGEGHWAIFTQLLVVTGLTGGAISDAWHAALAIEHGCEWWTFDRDFARFPGLRWRNLLG